MVRDRPSLGGLLRQLILPPSLQHIPEAAPLFPFCLAGTSVHTRISSAYELKHRVRLYPSQKENDTFYISIIYCMEITFGLNLYRGSLVI